MAIAQRKIGLYTLAGVAIAVVIIAAIFASGVQFPSLNSSQAKKGTLSVSIMDAPADLLHLNVTINALYVHNDDNDSWIKLGFYWWRK